jgi:thioredoxin 1
MTSHLTDTFHTGAVALAQLQQHSPRLILTKFIGPHCSSCETLKPVLNQLVLDYADRVQLVEVDMTEDPELAIQLGIRSIPTVIFFKGTQLLTRIVGLKPKKEYIQTIEKYL